MSKSAGLVNKRLDAIAFDTRPKSPSTIGHRQYLEFCRQRGYKAVPASDKTLCFFISDLAATGLPCHTIRAYLSSALQLHVMRSYPDPTADSSIFRLISRGIKCTASLISKPCLPLTIEIMKTLKKTLKKSSNYSEEDKIVLWAAFSIAFCGFLNFEEFCASMKDSFDSSTLTWQDIDIQYEKISLSVKYSTFENCSKQQIYMSATEKSVCPARALIKYKHYRRLKNKNLPAFILESGEFLTPDTLIQSIGAILEESGLNTQLFSSYSFKIGAAVSALESGVEPELIKTMCRLSKECCQLYKGLSENTVLQASKQMCS